MPPYAYIIGFISYVIILSTIAALFAKKSQYGKDIFFAGRSISLFLLVGTVFAAMVGTGSSIGALGYGYSNGWAGSLYGVGGAIGIILTALFFSKSRDYEFMSMAEEISYYYGANPIIKHVIAIWDVFISISWLALHIMGGGLLLSSIIAYITGKVINPQITEAIIAFSIILIIIAGGYIGIVWTNIIQAIIFLVGFSLIAVFVTAREGGAHEIIRIASNYEREINILDQASRFSFLGIEYVGIIPAISLVVSIAIGVTATSAFRHQMYSAENRSVIKHAFFISGFIYLIFSLIPAKMGIAAFIIASKEGTILTDANYAFSYLAFKTLHFNFGIIIIIIALSATISSATSAIFAGHMTALRNILPLQKYPVNKEKIPNISRILIIFMAVSALVLAVSIDDIINYITNKASMVMSGVFVVAILGKYWHKMSLIGGIAALIAAPITSTAMHLELLNNTLFYKQPIIPALAASFLCGIIFSLIFPGKRLSPKAALWVLKRERKKVELYDKTDIL